MGWGRCSERRVWLGIDECVRVQNAQVCACAECAVIGLSSSGGGTVCSEMLFCLCGMPCWFRFMWNGVVMAGTNEVQHDARRNE